MKVFSRNVSGDIVWPKSFRKEYFHLCPSRKCPHNEEWSMGWPDREPHLFMRVPYQVSEP
jgi:hypothetical protein